ncbi:HlyD family secretion protein [Argonema galeatum]|uniref:HlyD family secretion protein n=1 Tax=Argonema galeatum TaxID=2942762 RepID=UPI002012211E|nr:HlyD family secretion protein [Argonema galeatum]MCL1465593.1 efflux RND transporter periplasmic adaptor subunit [Argonema galeatum A003/A1]
MKRSNTAVLNGHKPPVAETELLSAEDLETLPVVAPDVEEEKEEKTSALKASRQGPMRLILAALGIGAIATAGNFGYHYWQYASTHQETDNATIAGHLHNVSSRINGTIADVLVDDNQLVQKGQLLVKLDPRDFQVKVQNSEAALEAARRQAMAAQANIALSAQTTEAKTATAQGDVGAAVAAISTAEATVKEAESGVPAAQAAVKQAEAGVPQAQATLAAAQAGVTQAQAAVTAAQAGVPQAQAAVKEAEAGVSGAQAQLAQAQANLERAETDYNRYKSLFESGAIARQQLDTAKAAYDVAQAQKSVAQQGILQAQARVAQAQEGVGRAQAQVAQAQQGVATAQAQVAQARQNIIRAQAQVAEANEGVTSAQAKVAQAQEGVASAQAKLAASKGGLQQATAGGQQTQVNRSQYEAAQAAIAQSEASLKDAQLQLSYADIGAPAAGRIGRKSVEVGQRVQPGTPLMAIVSSEYWVIANFKETQLEGIKPGEEVEIKLDAFPNRSFKGRVDSFSPASGSQFALLPPDNATGNFTKVVQRIPVKVVFDSDSIKDYESLISPGMSAVVSVEVK